MPSDYTFAKPDVALDEGIYAFLEEFYRITDDPEGHDLYTQQYTPDGTAIMATFKCKGTEEIRDFRQRMWDRVKARKHKIHRVFAAAPGSPEIMLYGEVKQTLRSGGDLVKEWAAHGVLEKSAEDGKWRWAFYQVYLARFFFSPSRLEPTAAANSTQRKRIVC
ncbi:hypothetical protein MCOR01_003426 [Pyricularia oryzae]|nr:hypothetical protein MCOR01_003426 [Pyricularia oryzae]